MYVLITFRNLVGVKLGSDAEFVLKEIPCSKAWNLKEIACNMNELEP